MLSDIARWSDSNETECLERSIRSLWYAVVLRNGVVDAWVGTMKRVRAIIDKVGYRGFTPIEALGEGDPAEVVTTFLHKVRKAFV